jgi:exodeoxyribonuclease VII large subunit
MGPSSAPPQGIPGSRLPGPFPVGRYADRLRERLREMARVQLFGEVVNLRLGRAKVYFELRDAAGALPCSMWRTDWERVLPGGGGVADGVQVVVEGGCDYYPGSRTSSPAFSFLATDVRLAGEGDLLAQIQRLRRQLDAEGLLTPQRALPRPALPRTIGVVCGEGAKARDDVIAGLMRRGWAGRLVWAYAPVQDRHAAPRITQALQDLAAIESVEVVVVARGGGSLADLLAFCDETLCRTVAMLRVPVIASIGHHTDRTLLDDVAAVSCSTPTHAAEAAVPIHCAEARDRLRVAARRLHEHRRTAVVSRARALAALARAPGQHVRRQRVTLHQQLREIRASARRGLAARREHTDRALLVLGRKAAATSRAVTAHRTNLQAAAEQLGPAAAGDIARRRRELDRLALALAAHEPERTLARGYALVESPDGEPIASAAAAGEQPAMNLRFHDGRVAVHHAPRADAKEDTR